MNTACSTSATPRVRPPGAERARRKGAAVRRSNDLEVALLAGRLIAAQESEPHRIARDLQDNLGQELSLLCMEIASLGVQTGVVATGRARRRPARARVVQSSAGEGHATGSGRRG